MATGKMIAPPSCVQAYSFSIGDPLGELHGQGAFLVVTETPMY